MGVSSQVHQRFISIVIIVRQSTAVGKDCRFTMFGWNGKFSEEDPVIAA